MGPEELSDVKCCDFRGSPVADHHGANFAEGGKNPALTLGSSGRHEGRGAVRWRDAHGYAILLLLFCRFCIASASVFCI